MLKKLLLALLAVSLISPGPALAQTTANPTVPGYYAPAPQNNCVVGPCFIPYGSSVPVSGSFSATLAGFTPNGSVANLAVSGSSANVALPTGLVVAVLNSGATDASIKLSVGAGTAATTDFVLKSGATVGLTVGSNTFINAITTGSSTTLSMAGGTGLVSGYGGGGSSSGSGGNVTVVAQSAGLAQDTSLTQTQTTVSGTTVQRQIIIDPATGSPISYTLPTNTNLSQVNTVSVLTGTGAVGTGAQRVAVGTDTATIAGSAPSTILNHNTAQVNGVTTSTGAGAVGTGAQRIAVGQDTTTLAGSAPGTAGSASSQVMTVQGVASMTPVQVSQATAANLNATVVGTGTFAVQAAQSTAANLNATVVGTGTFATQNTPTAGTTGGITAFTLTAAASTNATNVKGSAGNLYHVSVYNNSATLAWLSFYNTSGTPTCGTSIVYQTMIPANSTSGAGAVEDFSIPVAFSSGIGICVTTGIAGTGSVAATSYVVGLGYK